MAFFRSLAGPALALALVAARQAGADVPAGLKPGEPLSAANAALAEKLLPPEILEFYKRGEWTNAIAVWPDGKVKHEKEFEAGTKWNSEHLALDAENGIVDKATGKRPEAIIGYPFPKIDAADPQAGVKVVWNYFYGTYNFSGNIDARADLAWVSRKGLDRSVALQSHIFYYDGQKPKYRPKENPHGLLEQVLARVEAPKDLADTTALSWRFRESSKRDLNWTYVPALRRVREVSPTNRSDGFLGSDMTQDDGPFFDGKPEDFVWKLVGETEMLRLADPHSLKGEVERTALPSGGWRGTYKPGPFVGFEDRSWRGAPWAPVAAVLARRKLWIVEAVPKDRYYLYGKIQLYVDQEGYFGAWSRKFSWAGELLSHYAVMGALPLEATASDGAKEWFVGGGTIYLAALNLKQDRATVTGFPLGDRQKAVAHSRVPYDPAFFDYQALQKAAR